MTTTEIAPVVKELFVAAPVDRAWSVFVEDIAEWWPVGTHSIEPERVKTIEIEGRVGGRILERWHDGTEWSWGEIEAWEPPNRFRSSWHPSAQPSASTEIEVTFVGEENGTRVTLEHRNWAALGARAAEMREQYDGGWDFVLAQFSARTGRLT